MSKNLRSRTMSVSDSAHASKKANTTSDEDREQAIDEAKALYHVVKTCGTTLGNVADPVVDFTGWVPPKEKTSSSDSEEGIKPTIENTTVFSPYTIRVTGGKNDVLFLSHTPVKDTPAGPFSAEKTEKFQDLFCTNTAYEDFDFETCATMLDDNEVDVNAKDFAGLTQLARVVSLTSSRPEVYPDADRLFWILFEHPRVDVTAANNPIPKNADRHYTDLITMNERSYFMQVDTMRLVSNSKGVVLTKNLFSCGYNNAKAYLEYLAEVHPELEQGLDAGDLDAIAAAWDKKLVIPPYKVASSDTDARHYIRKYEDEDDEDCMDYTWVECTCGVGKDHFTKERKHDVKSPEFDFREYEAEEDELLDHEWPFRVKCRAKGCLKMVQVDDSRDIYCGNRDCNMVLCPDHVDKVVCHVCDDYGFFRCIDCQVSSHSATNVREIKGYVCRRATSLDGKTVHKQCGFCTANHEEDWKEKISVSKKGKTKVVTPFSYDYFCGGCISAFLSLPEDKCKFCGNTSICKDCITLDDKGRCPSCAKKNRVMCPRCNVNSIVPGEGLEFCTACFIREEMQKEREKVKSA